MSVFLSASLPAVLPVCLFVCLSVFMSSRIEESCCSLKSGFTKIVLTPGLPLYVVLRQTVCQKSNSLGTRYPWYPCFWTPAQDIRLTIASCPWEFLCELPETRGYIPWSWYITDTVGEQVSIQETRV